MSSEYHSTVEALLRRDRQVVIATLLLVIGICWAFLLFGAGTGMYPHEMAAFVPDQTIPERMHSGMRSKDTEAASMLMAPTAWTPGYTAMMFVMWWLMMIAMMLPSAAPMVLLHATVTRKSAARGVSASSQRTRAATAGFIGGYLLMWAGFSLAAVFAQWILEQSGFLSPMMTTTNQLLGACLLLAAGIWQLTPLKTVCLRHCRSPIGYLSSHWRQGSRGAFRMGIEHGLYCLGCCWFLMILLFYGGVMNLVWIIGLALLVLIEKLAPFGFRVARLMGLALIVGGGWLAFEAMG